MQYEVEATTEHVDSMFISWVDWDEYSLGKKKFVKPGVFEYEWVLEYMTHEDLAELIRVLQFAYEQGAERKESA